MQVSHDKPPPLPPRPREPFRLLETPPEGTPVMRGELRAERPVETLGDLGRELRLVRRELATLRAPSTPPPPDLADTLPPPRRPSRAAAVAAGAWKGTQWLGIVSLVLTVAAQVASLLKPGLAGPIQRAAEALETLAR